MLAASLLGAIGGCQEEAPEAAVGAPGGGNGGRPPVAVVSSVDAGTDGAADAAADVVDDLPAPFRGFSCKPLAPEAGGSVLSPSDFIATHAFVGWKSDCDTPTLVVGLADGECLAEPRDCDDGQFGSEDVCFGEDSQVLHYELDVGAILESRIIIGPNLVSPLSDGLLVRYRRPDAVPPAGTWGNCVASNGTLSVESIGTDSGDLISAAFNHSVGDCTSATNGPFNMFGDFAITIDFGLDDVCP